MVSLCKSYGKTAVFLSNTHHFSLHQSLKERHQILIGCPICGFFLWKNVFTGLFDCCPLGFCVNSGIDFCRTAVYMPKKIADVNKIDPCPDHMYGLAMAEHMRSDVEIYFKIRIILCLSNIFAYYVADAPPAQRFFSLIGKEWLVAFCNT